MIIYNNKSGAYLLDEASLTLGKKLNGLNNTWYNFDVIGIQANDTTYCNGRRIIKSEKDNAYSIFNYMNFTSANLIKYSNSSSIKGDLIISNKSGIFIWNNNLNYMYYCDWNNLWYTNINNHFSIIYADPAHKIIMMKEKGSGKLYIYKLCT